MVHIKKEGCPNYGSGILLHCFISTGGMRRALPGISGQEAEVKIRKLSFISGSLHESTRTLSHAEVRVLCLPAIGCCFALRFRVAGGRAGTGGIRCPLWRVPNSGRWLLHLLLLAERGT